MHHCLFFLSFFKDWDSTREINAYPPANGAYALYSKSKFHELFDHAADTYFRLENTTINPIFKVRFNNHPIKW